MPETITVNLLWYAQAQFAGYLVAESRGLGADRGIRLETTPLDFAMGPVKSVLSGTSDFGVASPAHILESDAPGELRMVLMIQQDSPLVYPVRRDSGISSLNDLIGRKVGVWPGMEDLEFRWMMYAAGIPQDAVERMPVTDTVAAFIDGSVASAQMTLYHELHMLESYGFPRNRLRLFEPREFGAALVKDGLFTTSRLIEERPEIVQAVVETVLEGWVTAFAAPREALAICMEMGSNLDRHEQELQMADIRALTFCNATLERGLGFPDPEHISRTATALSDLGEPVSHGLEKAILEPRFWHAAPETYKVRR